MDLSGIILLLGLFTVGMSFNINVILPIKVKLKFKKQDKYALQTISRFDGYLINQEKFLDGASLYRVEVEKRDDIKVLFPYVEKIVNYVGEDRLKLLYTNLKTVSVEKQKKRFSTPFGTCDSVNKEIRYIDEEILGHELLHLASSFYNKLRNEIQCGFLQENLDGDVEIGRGLNEGYTGHLSFKIFGYDKKSAYKNLEIVSSLLELFFEDAKVMEDFYFGHDLPGFVHYMEKYIPYDKMINIILRLDRMLRYKDYYEIDSIKEFVDIEMELYGYFKKSNPSDERLGEFENIIKKVRLGARALKREKMKLVKENLHNSNTSEQSGLEEDLAHKGIAM